jgi:hypothetical protein
MEAKQNGAILKREQLMEIASSDEERKAALKAAKAVS